MAIRGLLFDANGVLYMRPRGHERLERFLASHGIEALPRDRVKAMVEREREAAQTGEITIAEYYEAKLRAHGLTDPDALREGVRFMIDDSHDIDLFPNAVETLAGLRSAGLDVAIVTDSVHPVARKLRWLARKGLGPELFTAAVSSVEVGVRKPDPGIYLAALERMGLTVADAAFVGHATDELEGAAELGLTTIAFRPDDPDVEADVHIDDLIDLLEMVA